MLQWCTYQFEQSQFSALKKWPFPGQHGNYSFYASFTTKTDRQTQMTATATENTKCIILTILDWASSPSSNYFYEPCMGIKKSTTFKEIYCFSKHVMQCKFWLWSLQCAANVVQLLVLTVSDCSQKCQQISARLRRLLHYLGNGHFR